MLAILTLTKVAFSQNSSIKGKVIDEKTNETLPGAAVLIQGTTTGGLTDLDGNFTIGNVAPGKYTIVCQLVSYNTKVLSDVVVKEGEPAIVSITMTSASTELGPVEVFATVSKESNNNLLNLQKNNASLSDGISSESIKRSPDKATSDVIKRVSGASIQDNKFVIIRGLSDRYNTAMINGLPLPSTEPDRKAFSFDIFPSTMLDNMIIYKTASPDLPGDFAGGVIQINTKDIPEENFISVSAGTTYNSQSTFKPYKTYAGGKTDWLGVDDGIRALQDVRDFKNLLVNASTRYMISKVFQNDWGIDEKASSPLGQSYQVGFAKSLKLFKNDFGIVGALTYNYARRFQKINRRDFDFDGAKLFEYEDNSFKENVLWGAMLNGTYKIGERSKISLKNMFSMNTEDAVISREGESRELDQEIMATVMQYGSNKLSSSQLTGEHLLTERNIKLKWGASYSSTYRSIPNMRRMYYYKNLTPQGATSDTVFTAYIPFGAPSPNYAGKFWSKLNEDLYSGTLEVAVPFNFLKQKSTLKIGGSTFTKSRQFSARWFGYIVGSVGTFDWDLLYLPQDSIFAQENIGPNGFRLSEGTNPSDSYNARANLYAGYIMLDQSLTKNLRAVYGLRVENYWQQLLSKTYGGTPVNVDTAQTDLLPSINLTYALTEKMNLRVAASRTVARPDFRELSPFTFYDFNSSSGVIGNDTLLSTNITNYDFRYEWYPGYGQILSASVFYKDFKNPIESTVFFGGAGSRTYSYQNVDKATDLGFEVEVRFKLNLLDSLFNTKQFDNITLFSNFTYIQSEVDLSNVATAVTEQEKHRPMQGQSPYIINAGIQYLEKNIGLGLSLLYNKIGRRIALVGTNGYLNIYEAPRNLLDVQISQRFLKNGEIKLNISDIFNQSSIFYQDQDNSGKYEEETDSRLTNLKYGTNYSLSVSYKF